MSMSDLNSYFGIFLDFPNIKWDSKTCVLDLENLFLEFTKDERDDIIEECIRFGIIEPCKHDEYVITSKGGELWNNANNDSQVLHR